MKTLLATALTVFGLAALAAAQSAAVVVGSIVDQTGALLAGVRVTIRGVAVRMAATGAAGDFAFSDVSDGNYEISAELSGFERARRAVRVLASALRVAILEETVVTAAKAGERDLQSVPMAMSAVSSTEIARLGTQTVSDTPALAPSVTFSQNTGWGQLTIRGIGASTLLAGSDPSSAMYLDGVYLARPTMAFAQFLDLERIEVLRGPQGTFTWVGGVFLFDEADHQTLWIDQPPTRSQIRFDPRVDASGWFSVNLDIFRGSEPDVSQSYHNSRFT
jgi:outer membrane receptor protein involved in Fe transport